MIHLIYVILGTIRCSTHTLKSNLKSQIESRNPTETGQIKNRQMLKKKKKKELHVPSTERRV